MKKQSQQACRIANRVAISMVFAEASMHREQAQHVVDDALNATSQLLDDIDAVEMRSWFEGFESAYELAKPALVGDPEIRSRFVATQCDLLQQMGLYQKTIASVGDELGEWDNGRVSMSEFGDALDGLASLVTDHSKALSEAIENQAGNDSNRKRRVLVFSHAVCGIAIVLVAIDEAIKQKNPRSEACASIATFGAALTCSNVDRLFEVSGLVRV